MTTLSAARMVWSSGCLGIAWCAASGGRPGQYRSSIIDGGRPEAALRAYAVRVSLELWERKTNRKRADEHARTQLVAHGADVLKLSYRMLNPEGKEAESFDVWAKLPSPAALTADEPIVPLAFEFKPRTYPRLKARQVLGAAPPPTLTVAGCGGGVGKREGGPR